METPESPSGPGLLEPFEPVVTAPPVVAVVVTSNPGPWLEDTLASLATQDYPSLSVLVLDSASAEDPTRRIAAVMPHAYVRRLTHDGGFPAAANEALGTVEGATFLLFCHEDVVFDPTAVRIMVEEAYRSNAGIVGPKLVDHDRPDVLLEVGMAIDHYGVPFSPIEPNEVDQEQHDAVRDVFFVSHAAMLVRADLFGELSGFDVATFPGSDDLDLCWRARLAGARVLVAPDARVRHREVANGEEREPPGSPAAVTRAATRGRVRVLMKSYSGLALLWVLPTAFLLNTVEAIGLLFGRQRARARGLLAGWFATVREVGDVRAARRRAQSLRRVDDGDVRDLMVRGSARLRSLFTKQLHAGDRIQDVSNRTRAAVGRARGRMRHPGAVGVALVAAMLLVGSRALVFDRVPEIGSLSDWPGVGDLLRTFTAPWQRTGLGVDAPANPALAFMALLSTVLLGDSDLARTLVVAGAIPIGAFGVFRITRPLAHSMFPALAAAVAYVVNPVPRNAIAQGRLGSLVFFALAPFLLSALLRAAGSGAEGDAAFGGAVSRRALLVAALLTAVATAFFPAALLFAPLVALAFVLAVPLAGGAALAGRVAGAAGVCVAGAAVLLVPWAFSWFALDGAALGFLPRQALDLTEVLRFSTGPAGAGGASWGLLVAGALPLLVATGVRLMWAARVWVLVVLSYALAWVPGRVDAGLPRPEPEGVLVGAALGLAVATGIGVAAFADDLRRFLFGWRQFAAVVAAVLMLLPAIGFAADAIGGRWRMPKRDWADAVAWMRDDRRDGDFRVLWLGDPDVLPVGARAAHDTTYGLSRNGVGDVRDAFLAPAGDGEPVLDDAIGLLADRRTARFGHLLAPMGVRYIALVRRAAPAAGVERAYDERVRASLGEQLDLAVVGAEDDMLLYENRAWAPVRALVSADTPIEAPDDDAIEAALRAELGAAAPVRGPFESSRVPEAGTMLFGDAHDSRWELSAGGRTVEPVEAFGWSNAYEGVTRGEHDLHFDGGFARPALLLLETLLWAGAFGALVWLRRREPSGRATGPAT
jgi:GT2 family glycosyltransferase